MRMIVPSVALALSLISASLTLACSPAPPPPRYIVEHQVSAPISVGSEIVFTATRSQAHQDDEVFVVRCPAETFRTVEASCEWYPVRALDPASDADRARARAAVDLGCALTSITVQSGTPAAGFWIHGCGQQRFYRMVDGAWTDETPAR